MNLMRSRWLAGAALLAACAAMPGCQLWNAWLDALKWKGGNAQPLAENPKPSPQNLNTGPVPNAMVPRVAVYRITVPVGSFSGNSKIWSQLNEDAIDSKTAVLMAQNGLRAATGAVGRWPAVAAQLDVPATNQPQMVQTDGRTSINVLTRQNVTDQIVVSVDRDLQQQGRTFERCDNGFRLSIRGVHNKPELQVQLEPIVTLGTVQIVRPGIGVTSSGFTSEETFDDLRMAATLNSQQFLVISAMDPKASPFSVGTLWLSDHDKVPATETVLVFVPAAVK
ncbi:MAG TPA: hypothetical protein VHM90_03385 [Phycisphaerae bacterium]|nr:hypothetical protein [Phycisphaerae bacterium]